MRTLVIMRHAKAESSAPTDYERQLTERGHADATAAGEWLAEQGVVPDYVLVSAADRTTQTWEDVALGASWDLTLAEYDRGLYAASASTALDILRGVDDGLSTVLVIGHNPTMSSLVQLLDDGEGDDEASNELALGYPPAAVAVLSYDGDWSELDEAEASVTAFHIPRP
ncbi:phosphohistidine phosphatase [Nocardioides luteus]|uniref:Phosphohistidine phosphatase n=1 Tax=Nocardioides luteus TaxID=1844 RepID=A0ABQ5SQX5_9ACTN|nr:histidine phosphatase family protein [Nocardioides luteus]MDR7311008.1 phosphohistidine phosphatase [Nocardioides luteus]GGR67541.1 phosphohistidine phosphatase [Nocardioides luteus]GLJ66553.1 phosphohistidine phosphatase [Nocardioides luteus]